MCVRFYFAGLASSPGQKTYLHLRLPPGLFRGTLRWGEGVAACPANPCMSLPAVPAAPATPCTPVPPAPSSPKPTRPVGPAPCPALAPSQALAASLPSFSHLILHAGLRLSWQKLSWQHQWGSAGESCLNNSRRLLPRCCLWLGIHRRCRGGGL